MRVCKSRFTPNLENAKNVELKVGDIVTYRDPNGKEGRVEIRSDIMGNKNSEKLGYEVSCEVLGNFWASEDRIVDWDAHG